MAKSLPLEGSNVKRRGGLAGYLGLDAGTEGLGKHGHNDRIGFHNFAVSARHILLQLNGVLTRTADIVRSGNIQFRFLRIPRNHSVAPGLLFSQSQSMTEFGFKRNRFPVVIANILDEIYWVRITNVRSKPQGPLCGICHCDLNAQPQPNFHSVLCRTDMDRK